MKNILAENMRRFATKNLTEAISNEQPIARDATALLADLKMKNLITKGDVYGNAPHSQGKLNIEVYPTTDTTINLDKLFPELDKHYANLGRSDTGKMTYQFAKNLYGWVWNNVGDTITIVLMRKRPIK